MPNEYLNTDTIRSMIYMYEGLRAVSFIYASPDTFCVCCCCCCCCCSDVAAVEAGQAPLHEVTAPGLTPFLWSPEAGRGWPGGHCTGAPGAASSRKMHSRLLLKTIRSSDQSEQIRLNRARLSQQHKQIIFGLTSHS